MAQSSDGLRDFSVGFFDDPLTQQAVSRIAAAESLTIFAGAGVAFDQQLPSWAELVAEMLARALRRETPSLKAAEINRRSRDATDSYYQIPAASMVDALYQKQHGDEWQQVRNQDMHDLLYNRAGSSARLSPSLVDQILKLAHAFKADRRDVHIVTTNYDNLIQQAARTSDLLRVWEFKAKEYAGVGPDPALEMDEYTIPVVHVHGMIPQAGQAERVVFSERDYFSWDDNSPFRNYLVHRFSNGCVLFVGSSLRDNNIAGLLSRMNNVRSERYALVPMEAEFRNEVGQARFDLGNLLAYRGSHLGVQVLRADFFGQNLQFLDEVSTEIIRSQSGPSKSYSQRLRLWAREWSAAAYNDRGRIHQATQDLQEIADAARALVPDAVAAKAEIWVRSRPEERELELWCDSQAIRQLTASHYRRRAVQIDPLSEHAAVRSFAQRSAVQGRTPVGGERRWTHFLCAPVLLEGVDGELLPVGSLAVLLYLPGHVDREQVLEFDANATRLLQMMRAKGAEHLRMGR